MQDASNRGYPFESSGESVKVIKLRRAEKLLLLFPARIQRIRTHHGDPVLRIASFDGWPIVELRDELPIGMTMLDLEPPFICLTRAAS